MTEQFHMNTALLVAAFCLTGAAMAVADDMPVDLGPELGNIPEIERLRYFREINAAAAITGRGLTGDGVRVTIMGETVDPEHPDLKGRVMHQFTAADTPGTIEPGAGPRPLRLEELSVEDGHGTHIAGIIAADADELGIQGIASRATLDVYDLGIYGPFANADEDAEGLRDFMTAFTTAITDVTRRGESKIVTGSFNLETLALPALAATDQTAETVQAVSDSMYDQSAIDDGLAFAALSPGARRELGAMVRRNDGEMGIAAMALLPGTPEWADLVTAIAAYQQSGGVYLVTESNSDFGNHSSLLNALPDLSDRIDPDLWLSVVMTAPEAAGRTTDQAEMNAAMQGRYTTPLNGCGEQAQAYCISTPSYFVLSTMTSRVAFPDAPLFQLDGRTYQALSGHSMGAPMVAATLALMDEYNNAHDLGLSMADLVRVLKSSANRDFAGYDPVRNGVGRLDVGAALDAMAKIAAEAGK